jgi:hypothetical protein
MYIRTREGLGQGQAVWSTLQPCNRPTAQPTPIGYLGNFNEHMGEAKWKSCYVVWGFNEGSVALLASQKEQIKKYAIGIVRLLKRDIKGKGDVGVHLRLLFEGHADKKEPAQYKAPAGRFLTEKVDEDRALLVSWELQGQIKKEQGKSPATWFHPIYITPEYSGAGSTRPYRDGSDSKKNRRVVVCVRWEIVDKAEVLKRAMEESG